MLSWKVSRDFPEAGGGQVGRIIYLLLLLTSLLLLTGKETCKKYTFFECYFSSNSILITRFSQSVTL